MKEGTAIAITTGRIKRPTLDVTIPPMARPFPFKKSGVFLVLIKAIMPRMRPGMAVKTFRHRVMLMIPSTRLQTAQTDVFGRTASMLKHLSGASALE